MQYVEQRTLEWTTEVELCIGWKSVFVAFGDVARAGMGCWEVDATTGLTCCVEWLLGGGLYSELRC